VYWGIGVRVSEVYVKNFT